ncbi:MAG TPA: GAF domain-containing protein [Candidatus Limnocylindrales bacterium]|nr:GAF domain-containing protein [Candidatus Limnocylindrales bacterium]
MATTRPRRRAPELETALDPTEAGVRAPRAGHDVEDDLADGAPAADLLSPGNRGILHHALEEAARLLRSDGAMAYVLDRETGILRFADDAGITDDRRRRWVRNLSLEPGVGLFGRSVAERRTLITGDYPNDRNFVHFPDADRVVRQLAIRSFVVAPLIAGDRTFGAMGTYSNRTDSFDENDVALVRALADHAAAAMANAELVEELGRSRAEVERRAEGERALRELGAQFAAVREPAAVLQLAVDAAAGMLHADGARIDLLNEADGALYWAYDARTGRQPGLGPIGGSGEAKAGEGISGRAVREMQPVVTGDYLADDRFEHATLPDAHVQRYGIRSVVAVPLLGDRGPLGTLTVYTGETDAFMEDDARLLEALAGQAAIAMTNANLIERLERSQAIERRRADEERALREIAARITAIRDPSEILQDVVDEAARLLGAERVRIDLIGKGAGRVGYTFLGAGPHIGGAAVDEDGEPYRYGASGRAIEERRTIVVDDYFHDDSFSHTDELDAAVRDDGIQSLVITPLIAEDALLGVLQVGAVEAGAFGDDQVGLVEALAHQAAIAIHNTRLIQALERSGEEIRRRATAEGALREIATRITAIRDPEELLQQVVDSSRRLLNAERAQLDIVDPATGLIRWSRASGEGEFGMGLPGTTEGTPAEVGINGVAIDARTAVITGDYLADPRIRHIPDSDGYVGRVGLHSVVAVPLLSDTDLLGILKVATIRPDAYDDEDAALMAAFADQIVVAIQNARLIDQLGRSREEISRRADAERSVREIAANISALQDVDAILQQTVDEARRLLHSTSARIDMLEPDGKTMSWAYASGEDAIRTLQAGFDGQFQVGEGIAGRAVATGTPFRTGDYLADDRFAHTERSDALVRETAFRSVLCSPLNGEGGPLGAISVSSTERDHYDEAQSELLSALADQAAIAIQNARLIDELKASRETVARRAEAEQSLREIAAQITAITDAGSLLQQVVDAANRLVAGDGAVIDLVEQEGTLLRWAFDAGAGEFFTPDEIATMTLPVGVGATGLAVAENRVIIANDDPRTFFPDSEVNDRFFDSTGYRSMIVAPITGESGPLGALEVYSHEPGAFDEADAEVIRSLAAQAAIAITNTRLVEEINQSRREVGRRAATEQALREIAARITAIRDTHELLQHVADEAGRLLDAEGAIIDLLDPITGSIGVGYVSGLDAERTERWTRSRVGVDIVRRALAERTPLHATVGIAPETPPPGASPESAAGDAGLRSIAIAPLVSERGALGTLAVFSSQPDRYGVDDANLLGALADQAAIAMLNARLIDELERSQTELAARAETERSLRDIAARITSLGDPGEILARVVEESRRLLRSDGAHLTRMSEDGTYLVPVITAGAMDPDTDAWLKQMEFPLGGGINGLAAEEVQPIWTYDYQTDPRIPHEPEDDAAAERLGLRAMAAAPLRAPAGEVIGTLAISYAEPRDILPDELDLLQGLADQAAIALTNSNLYELLGESEQRYRYLVQNSPDLVWSIDADAKFTFVSNTTSLRLTGWRADELLGKHFGALVHPSSREVAEIDWTAGFDDAGAAGDRELRGRVNLLHKDGHAVPAEFIAFANRDEAGLFAGANGSVRDMSERDRLERELRDSEHRFRFLVANSPDIIFAIDPEGRFTYVSPTVERSLGLDPERLLGTHFIDLIDYQAGEVPGERFAMLAANPDMELTNRIHLKTADGRVRPFEVSSVAIQRDGHFAGIQGAARDVTERDRLERELRESEERYRFLVDNSPDIVFSTDRDGVFTYLSDSIERITGFSPAEYTGRHFSGAIDPASLPAAAERWAMLVAEPEVRQILKLDLLRKEGGTVPVEVSSIGSRDADGAFSGIHGATRDITDRERLERDLRRQAGELASSQERAHLARELHDSVTQALFSMTLVTRTIELQMERDPEAAREKLGSLRDLQREALAEMRALIFELRPGNLETDGLLPALRTHTAALQGRIGLPIVVTSELTDRLPLEVEEVLYRIAQEALHNVVKHAAARQVQVSLDRRAGDVVLRIRDDGKGFDQTAVPEGHLGITGMRARADKIGASYVVTSRAGEGTTVEVVVPPAAIERAASTAALSPAGTVAGAGAALGPVRSD